MNRHGLSVDRVGIRTRIKEEKSLLSVSCGEDDARTESESTAGESEVTQDHEESRRENQDEGPVPEAQESVTCTGLWLRGACFEHGQLLPPLPDVNLSPLPRFQLVPYEVLASDGEAAVMEQETVKNTVYSCPVFQVEDSSPCTSLFSLDLPTDREHSEWDLSGIAAFCLGMNSSPQTAR